MSTRDDAEPGVLAVVFDDWAAARGARRKLRAMMHTHALCVDEAAVCLRGRDGSVRLEMRRGFWLEGLVGGGLWGVVLGGACFQPAGGGLAGLLCGGVAGALTRAGLDPGWLEAAALSLEPGAGALVLSVRHGQDADALSLLAGESGRVIADASAGAWGTAGGRS